MKGSYNRAASGTTSDRLRKLALLQAIPFIQKIELTKEIIIKSEKIGNSAILYSGGKDSTVLLHLIMSIGLNPLVIYNNTTLGNKEIDDYIRLFTNGMNFVETIADDPVAMWKEKGYFPILSKRGHTAYKKKFHNLRVSPVQCCYNLKEKYSNPILKNKNIRVVFWGNRAGESNRRKLSFCDNGFLFKPKKYSWHQSYPLQHWNTEDVIKYIQKNIPAYVGLKGLENGCLCCGSDITFKQNNLIHLFKKDYEKWLFYMQNGFAEQILIAKGLYMKISIDEAIENKFILLRV